jgi:ABC-type polysaccharide/polyol phosphate transport system ATPase subunit
VAKYWELLKKRAGKSTAQNFITVTYDWYKVCGCAASLLEVGTGFTGEMTGRENILNGAIFRR